MLKHERHLWADALILCIFIVQNKKYFMEKKQGIHRSKMTKLSV